MHLLIPQSRLHVYRGGHLGLVTEAAELAPVVDNFRSVLPWGHGHTGPGMLLPVPAPRSPAAGPGEPGLSSRQGRPDGRCADWELPR